MSIGTFHSIWTVVLFVSFLGSFGGLTVKTVKVALKRMQT